ncbi:MAG: hypothetical protein AAF709_24705 [Pseudomonadota bacterium]
MPRQTNFAATLSSALIKATSATTETNLDIKFAGTLEFAEDGTLFVGDNKNGGIYAFEMPAEGEPQSDHA